MHKTEATETHFCPPQLLMISVLKREAT